jgi:hypothetical protein
MNVRPYHAAPTTDKPIAIAIPKVPYANGLMPFKIVDQDTYVVVFVANVGNSVKSTNDILIYPTNIASSLLAQSALTFLRPTRPTADQAIIA